MRKVGISFAFSMHIGPKINVRFFDFNRAGMKKEHVSENSIMIYDDVMYPDNVTYEHIGEISIS